MKSNERFYQGHQNTTALGLSCQTWFSCDPGVQTMHQGIFPELNLAIVKDFVQKETKNRMGHKD